MIRGINLIDEKELDMIVGGLVVGGYRYEGHVGKYDGIIGEDYYFVNDDNNSEVYHGRLIESGEETWHCFWSKRYHIFQDLETGQYHTVYGDDWTMYKFRIKV